MLALLLVTVLARPAFAADPQVGAELGSALAALEAEKAGRFWREVETDAEFETLLQHLADLEEAERLRTATTLDEWVTRHDDPRFDELWRRRPLELQPQVSPEERAIWQDNQEQIQRMFEVLQDHGVSLEEIRDLSNRQDVDRLLFVVEETVGGEQLTRHRQVQFAVWRDGVQVAEKVYYRRSLKFETPQVGCKVVVGGACKRDKLRFLYYDTWPFAEGAERPQSPSECEPADSECDVAPNE